MNCYPKAVTVKTITWTHNNTGSDPTTLSSNKLSITFTNETRVKNNTIIQVNMTVIFSNGVTISDSRLVMFLSYPVVLSLTNDNYYLP